MSFLDINTTVSTCTLIGNNASCGGAVNVQGNGSLSMSGTAIIGNTSDDHGGGVYNQGSSGTVTLTNCTIKYNYAGANGGGGVRVYKSKTTIIDGCTITDNACSGGTHGGGICVGGLEDSDSATIKLKGDISINNNFCSDTEENLYLSDKNGGSFVYVDGKLSDTASIGVTMSGPGVFTKTDDENKEAWNDVSKFTSDNASYFVSKNTDGQLFIGTPISSVAVTDITAPVATEALDTEAATSTGNVSLGTVTWKPAAASAAYATEYTATVIATANVNYAFTDKATATVNGKTANVTKNEDGTLSISYTFDKTALTPVTIGTTNKGVTYSSNGIAIPVEGMFTIPEGAGTATYSVANGTGEGTYDAQTGKLTVTACGTFTVKVSTAASDTHAAGTETSATLTVNKATAPAVTVPTPKAVTYDPTKKLEDVTLPDGWAWVTATTVPTVGNTGYDAELTVDDANYDYTGVEGYNAQTHKVTGTVSLTVNKSAVTAATVTANNRTYDGTEKPLVTVTGETTGGTLKIAVTRENQEPADEAYTFDTTSIPVATNAGTYYVWYKVKADANHNDSNAASIPVTINKANITPTVKMDGWTAGETAKEPNMKDGSNPGKGKVTYTYAKKGENKFTSDKPTTAGQYTVKAEIAETDNYKDGSATADFTVAAKPHEHTWGDWEVTKKATCVAKGEKKRTCSECKQEQKQEIDIDPANHTGKTEIKNAKKATESAEGYTGDTYCKDCGVKLKSGKAIPKLSHKHTWGEWKVTKKATCVAKGEKKRTCSECKEEDKQEIAVDPKNHTGMTEVKGAKDATTDKEGYTGDTHCKDCGKKLKSGKAIPKLEKPEKVTATKNFRTLRLVAIRGKKAVTLKWRQHKKADGYLIYGCECGEGSEMKLLETITKAKTTSWTQKKLKKGTYYKYRVVAYKKVKGKQKTVNKSMVAHAITHDGKTTAIKSVKVKKSEVKLKKGETFKIKASETKENRRKKIAHHRVICYESSDESIVKVNAKGKVKGVKKGEAVIFVYAETGHYKTVKVTVK